VAPCETGMCFAGSRKAVTGECSCVYMCVCIFVCVNVLMCVCIYRHVLRSCTQVVCGYLQGCHVRLCVCMCVCMCVHLYRLHACIHKYILA